MATIYEKALQALQHREAIKDKTQDQNWGIASAVDDIRTKVVEEGYWQRPEGRAVTDDIQPSTLQSFYQSHHSPAEPEHDKTPEIEREPQHDKGLDI